MFQPGVNVADQNITNGLPNKNQDVFQEKHHLLNGVHSSHSSRSSSPSTRLGYIPSSQLPPTRPIPQSQLPPSHSPVTAVTQKLARLNVGATTPNISPKLSSSTPDLQRPLGNFGNSAFSPINSTVPNDRGVPIDSQNNKEHDNVPLTNNNLVSSSANVSYSSSQQMPNSFVPVISNQNLSGSFPQQKQIGQPLSNFPASQSQQRPVSQFSSQSQNTFRPPFPNQPTQSVQNYQNIRPAAPCTVPRTTGPLQNVNSSPNFIPNANMPPKPVPPNTNQPSPISQNQFRPNMSSPNLYQPQLSQNIGPPPSPQTVMSQKSNLHSNRYPSYPNVQQNFQQPQLQNKIPIQQTNVYQQQSHQGQQNVCAPQQQFSNVINTQQQPYNQFQSVVQSGFNKQWGTESYDLLETPNIMPPTKVEAPRIHLGQELLDQANCSAEIFSCTMTKIPENNSLLQKSRLPLGVLIHPFRDLRHLPVIQCNVIVRCRACRTYINPFVFFVDSKRWKCNLCYRINELPEEFQYDPVSKSYGDPSRRPEIKSSTIEYIAPAEYMLRPPQPAVYLYLLDVSRLAVESGYLQSTCKILLEELKNLPGDARTQIGFVAYDSALHFYSLAEGLSQPHEMTVLEIDDVFLPTPDNLLVNLKDRMELVADLLTQLPTRYVNTYDTNSALGAALQVAYKMMGATGGRVTVFQAAIPNVGPGALCTREDPSHRGSAEVSHLNPANDFYKRLALECSGQQIAVDLFILNSTYVDIATVSGISRFSGGCIHQFPLFKVAKQLQCKNFERCFRRYLTRKIGFEAVMRVRCTRGLAIHTFHGNLFVRSTDLLSLPNINPDAGFGMQVAIEENLSDVQTVCFQAALLYTSSKGERRIRVHTLCLPIAATLHDIIQSADQQCIVGLLSKMAVDRSMQSSLSDAREAFLNVAIDILSSYKLSLNMANNASGLLAPNCLKLLPLYISALLKHPAFRTGTSTRLDDRVKAMIDMKTKPLYQLIQMIYPDLYPIHNLEEQDVILNSEEESVSMPPRLQLSARCLENKGAFLMDLCDHMVILVCPTVSQDFLQQVLGVASYDAISDQMYDVPVLDNVKNQKLHMFINYLNEDKPFTATVQVIRDNSPNRIVFLERLVEDRGENTLSYHEFLQHLKTQVK